LPKSPDPDLPSFQSVIIPFVPFLKEAKAEYAKLQ
jgi:hypothetical protein